MTIRGVVAVLLASAMGLAGCGGEWRAEPEPPTEAELVVERAQERQQQLDDELERWRELDMDDHIVAPMDEPIVDRWLTTSLGELYIDGFGLCSDVTITNDGALPKNVAARDWHTTYPSGFTSQGIIHEDDLSGYSHWYRRGLMVVQPGETRTKQICLGGADERQGILPGLYKIEFTPALMQTHVWLTVI